MPPWIISRSRADTRPPLKESVRLVWIVTFRIITRSLSFAIFYVDCNGVVSFGGWVVVVSFFLEGGGNCGDDRRVNWLEEDCECGGGRWDAIVCLRAQIRR